MKEQIKWIRNQLRDIAVNNGKRSRLANRDFTLISSDCTGGMVYHEFKQQFRSPTVNMYFDAGDYIRFIKNTREYLDASMVGLADESRREGYPVAMLGDIRLHLVHYASVGEAREAWDRRKRRINWDNCFYIMNDRNGCTPEDMKDYDTFITRGGIKESFLPTSAMRSWRVRFISRAARTWIMLAS